MVSSSLYVHFFIKIYRLIDIGVLLASRSLKMGDCLPCLRFQVKYVEAKIIQLWGIFFLNICCLHKCVIFSSTQDICSIRGTIEGATVHASG